MELDKKILDRIEREKISVRPKWFFAAKDFSFGLIDAVFLAGFFIAGMMLLYYYKTLGTESFLSVAFFVWAGLLAISLFVILKINKKIAGLYKLRLIMVLPILLIANSTFGFYSNEKGLAGKVEEKMEKNLPAYEKIIPEDFKTIRNEKQESDRAKEDDSKTKSDQSENQPQIKQPENNPEKGQNKDIKNNKIKGSPDKSNQKSSKLLLKKPVQVSRQRGNGNTNQITKGNVFKMMKYF